MKIDNTVSALLIAVTFSCTNSERPNDVGKSITDSNARPGLEAVGLKDPYVDSARILKKELDNMLTIEANRKNGYYYFERADCLTVLELYQESNSDLEKASKLGYLPARCKELMKINNELSKSKKRYN